MLMVNCTTWKQVVFLYTNFKKGWCETWRYFDIVIPEFKRILGTEVA